MIDVNCKIFHNSFYIDFGMFAYPIQWNEKLNCKFVRALWQRVPVKHLLNDDMTLVAAHYRHAPPGRACLEYVKGFFVSSLIFLKTVKSTFNFFYHFHCIAIINDKGSIV